MLIYSISVIKIVETGTLFILFDWVDAYYADTCYTMLRINVSKLYFFAKKYEETKLEQIFKLLKNLNGVYIFFYIQ